VDFLRFNPQPRLSVWPLGPHADCVVADDALVDPQALVDWAGAQRFVPPAGYPYPGLVLQAPAELTQRVADFLALHARTRLGARRTLELTVRLSLVTVPPQELEPRQWLCHRDRIDDSGRLLFAASVLYLFRDPALGGTSFYRPRLPPEATDQLIADSMRLDAQAFGARHGLQAGYMGDSNAYFERVATVPAAWNRMIFYDGGLFHSADVGRPALLSAHPAHGRLTLNSFFTCRRQAV
jgi:Family of unknown function (DUF6445)